MEPELPQYLVLRDGPGGLPVASGDVPITERFYVANGCLFVEVQGQCLAFKASPDVVRAFTAE